MEDGIDKCDVEQTISRSREKVLIQNECRKKPKVQISKRKLFRLDKPRKVLKSDSATSYERRNEEEEDDQSDGFCFSPDQNGAEAIPLSGTYRESTPFSTQQDSTTEELSLGPQAFGLIPVPNPPQASEATTCHCNCHSELEKRFCSFERKFTLLQNKHTLLQQSHDKLAQLVEAQNHLLACHTPPPPSREASSTFISKPQKQIIKSPRLDPDPLSSPQQLSPARESQLHEPHMRSFLETPDLLPDAPPDAERQFYTLPRRATVRDIIRLWEEGSRALPPVKNWSPAQKMKVQSKLSRWKKIIDIFKTECNGDMTLFEDKYSNEDGDLLPVTTILALHDSQLSSNFLSKGFTNVKQDTIVLKSPVRCKQEFENEPRYSTDDPEEITTPDDVTTNRYVLPRKVTARDVVQLWDDGCDDFPPIGSWSKAQKIGQETKIFRWKKIVDVFKTDCNSDWDMFQERYSNDKGELLPLATILAKHEAMYAKDHEMVEKQAKTRRTSATPRKTSEPPPCPVVPTTTDAPKTEKSSRGPDSITLPRKVTAFEVVRYWTDGCETFGPVKDWTREQKMGQETKISRWKKIYEIFRFQCCRNWDEFCRRYTNQRGELLPIATILGKYEAENPMGAPSYQLHENESHKHVTPGLASQVIGENSATNFTDDGWALPQPVDVDVTVNDAGEYVLPAQLTAVQALSLWEHGTDEIPPLKNWSEEQAHQPALLDSIRRMAEIFERDCGSHYRRFLDRFSDTDGELLPITGIIYSSHCRKYSPFFTEYEKSVKSSRSRGEQYELPKRIGAKEIVWLWEHGCRDFPPVKTWSSAQKLRYTTKLSRWRKIVDVFHDRCDSNWRIYEEKYSNANGELLALSTVISMQEETESESYASMIKRSPDHDGETWHEESSSSGINMNNACDAGPNEDGDTPNESDPSQEFHLPKKVSAVDIINLWEHGFGNMPPVGQWTSFQRFRQRSKISRWSKIYDIYKNHCKGNLVEFENLYSDKNGQLLPATTIISMYESRVDADQYNENEVLPKGPVVRKYVLPRKVDAKDIVRLWEEGNESFPPIAAWTKADKIGQETKIFRWKKIVDIFKNHCDSDWEYFEDLFSNEFGELLPTSAIIAKFETSFLKR